MSEKNTMNACNEIAQSTTSCDSKLLDSTTLNECDNKYYVPMGRTGPLVAKIPVVLSDVEIQIDVESEIRLEEAAFDIKTVDKHTFLTECKLIPHTNKLFIAGFVQKNIQYSTVDCTNKTSVSGKIQHTTVNIPFKCVTKIQFSKSPIYGKDYKKRLNALDGNMLGKDQREDSWVHYSKPFEPVFCELECTKILETDIINKQCHSHNSSPKEETFQELIVKMVIFIRLKVLQNQQVNIPEPNGDVAIVERCSMDNSQEYFYDNNKKDTYIEVGFDPEKGMIGKETYVKGLEED
jgi:hypothetical protein